MILIDLNVVNVSLPYHRAQAKGMAEEEKETFLGKIPVSHKASSSLDEAYSQ